MDILFYTNIPTPYRTFFFNKLCKFIPNIEVWYQRGGVPYRPWSIVNLEMKHKYINGEGVYYKLRGFHFFTSLKLLRKLLTVRPKLIVLGLGWNDIDALIIIVFSKLGLIQSTICFWSEANYLTNGARNDNILKYIARRFVYNQLDVHVSSGEMTEITLNRWGVKKQTYIRLPNCIEEETFQNLETASGEPDNSIKILIAARIVEKLKGIINFL